MYFLEKFIIISVWIISFISIFFIPKEEYRHASVIFLLAQLPAWIFGLLVVEAGLIQYPVRELYKANGTSFTFEYLVLPLMCIFFNIHFPQNKSFYNKITYYLTILLVFSLIEYFTEKHTLILKYIHWHWYTTFITMGIFIYFVRSAYKWFFNLGKPFSL